MMHLQSLKKVQVNTKFGQKEKYIITDESGNQFDSWCSEWNSNWKEGFDIEIRPDQIESREYNGKTYKTIKCPPELKSRNFSYGNTGIAEDIKMINAKLNKIIEILETKDVSRKEPVEDEPPIPESPF